MIELRAAINPVPWSCGVSDSEATFVEVFRTLAALSSPEPLDGPLAVSWLLARRAPSSCASSVGELVRGLEVAGTGVLWRDVCQLVDVRAHLVATGPKVSPFISVRVKEVG